MRQLAKHQKPAILVEKEEEWTRLYLAASSPTERRARERWRHDGIKAALSLETLGKCAYCEAFMADVAFPNVEHVIPKAVHPELAHMWPNLTSACPPCNVAKDDFFDADSGILNPYEDDIGAQLRFLGDLVDWNLGAARGEITVKRLKLNRMGLVYSRVDRVLKVREMLERWNDAPPGVRRDVIADGIRLDAVEGEFTQTVLAYLRAFGFPVDETQDEVAS